MSWVRLDDQAHAHPKINRAWHLDPAALGLHLLALSYCGAFAPGGEVPTTFTEQKLPDETARDRAVGALVEAGLWTVNGAGWLIHDFTKYTAAGLRAKRAAAGRAGGLASGRSRRKARSKQTASKRPKRRAK